MFSVYGSKFQMPWRRPNPCLYLSGVVDLQKPCSTDLGQGRYRAMFRGSHAKSRGRTAKIHPAPAQFYRAPLFTYLLSKTCPLTLLCFFFACIRKLPTTAQVLSGWGRPDSMQRLPLDLVC